MNTNKLNMKLLATITIMLLFASAMVTMVPSANAVTGTVLPASAGPGEVVTVSGTATNTGSTIVAYWNTVSEEARLNSTRLSGTNLAFSFRVTIPEAYYNATADHAILLAEELSSGSTSSTTTYPVPFTIIPHINLTLPTEVIGQSVTINGGGFSRSTSTSTTYVNFKLTNAAGAVDLIDNLIPANSVQTNNMGSFSASFTVPSVDKNGDTIQGDYRVVATDTNTATAQTDWATLKVGPVIVLSPSRGPTGTIVTITGRGFNPGADVAITKTDAAFTFANRNQTAVTVTPRGTFTTTIMITGGAINTGYDITATDSSTATAVARFNVATAATGNLTTNLKAGEPTTAAGPGTTIDFDGRYFTTIAGTNVTLEIVGNGITYEVTRSVTSSSGTFSGSFVTPNLPTAKYELVATDGFGIVGRCDFAVALTPVIVTPYIDLTTGTKITISGAGFDLLGSSYTANVSINGQILSNGRRINHGQVTNGIDAIIGVDGSTTEPGRYLVEIITSTGLYGKTYIDVVKTADITVDPAVASRNSTITVTGTAFTPGEPVELQILNASNNARISTYYTVLTGSAGNFTHEINLPVNFALGEYIINATDLNGITAAKNLSVVKVSVDIALGASTYNQGEIGTFRLTSNTAPTGKISVYDSNGALVTTINLETSKWTRVDSGGYAYIQSSGGGVPSGALFTVASDARVGTWTWKATINDANEPQTYDGTFTVNARGATPTPATPTPTPATPTPTPATPTPTPATPTPATPTPTPAEPTPTTSGGNDNTTLIIVVAVVALIVGVIAVFLFITMRRKIAN